MSASEHDEKVPRTVTWVDGRAATFPAVHGTPTDSFLSTAFSVVNRGSTVADAGCGAGAFTLMLASRARTVVGADKNEDALRAAVGAAKERKVTNASFYQSDLEAEPWSEWAPAGDVDVVTMHLFGSAHAFKEAARVLKPRGSLVVSVFGPGQWQETRQPSEWAWTPEAMRRALADAGFELVSLVNDLVFVNAPDFKIMQNVFFQGGVFPVVREWRANGRWQGLQESFDDGTRGLTESRLVAHAVRRPA